MKLIINQFIKFGIIGILNTAVGLSIIFFCMKVIGISYVISNITGYTVGLINSFFWNRKWTFNSINKIRHEIVPFLIVFLFSYAIQFAGLVCFVEYLNINKDLSQLLSTGIYTLANFTGNRLLTFNQ